MSFAGLGAAPPAPTGNIVFASNDIYAQMWSDAGSGASEDGSMWACVAAQGGDIVPKAFMTRRHHDGPGYAGCFGLDPARAVPE